MNDFPIPLHKRLRFVLVETSAPGNVGAAARAIKTMGFEDLWLVRPRSLDILSHPEAHALASGAQDVLAKARIVQSLPEAISGCSLVAALSARPREYAPPVATPHDLGIRVQNEAGIALVFGGERAGLSNEDVLRANLLVQIPANPAYSSLNLAQAVQLLAWECRAFARDTEENSASDFQSKSDPCTMHVDAAAANAETATTALERMSTPGTADWADAADTEGMFEHLERALLHIQFLDPDKPGRLMPRLRRLFARTRLETEEVNILRGIAQQLLSPRARVRPKELPEDGRATER